MSNLYSESEFTKQLGHKILIAGLSEAGKTATKRIFFLRHKPKKVSDLAATINYDRLAIMINDVPLTILDLGGQRVFVKRFLHEMSPFIFNNVRALIFLIDVSNRTTRNSSVAYFTACVERLQNFSPNVKSFVLLHKNDLVENWPNYENIHEQLKEQFQLASSEKVCFFRTSIYRPNTVINSFGRIVELIEPELAKSDFVDGKEIGPIEEVTEQFVTLREIGKEKKEKTLYQISETEDGKVKNLKALMQQSLNKPLEINNNIVDEGITTNEQKPEKELISQKELAIPVKEVEPNKQIPLEQPLTKMSEIFDKIKPNQHIIDFRIKNLINFSKITLGDASELVKNDYDSFFSLAISSGIPLKVALNIFLKYIPLMKKLPGFDQHSFTNDRILSVFMAYTQNLIKEKEIFDFLLIYCENPDKTLEQIVELVNKLDQSKYESILSSIEDKIEFQHPMFKDKFIAGLSSNTQKRINKLLIINSDLQIEEALKIVENNFDDFYVSSISAGISYELIHDILFKKLNQIKDRGLNIKILSNLHLFRLVRDSVLKGSSILEIENRIIILILKPQNLVDENISILLDSPLTTEPDKYKRIEHLLRVTNEVSLDIATKLVEVGYEDIIDNLKMTSFPLVTALRVFFQDIPSIKSEGFNIHDLNQQKILTTLNAFQSELIQEEDIKDCLTLMIINPDSPVLEIVNNIITKSNVQAIKTKELENVKKDIQSLPLSGNYGFRVALQEGNCLLTLYQDGKEVGNALVARSIPLSNIEYLLTFELNLPFEVIHSGIKETAEVIHKAIIDFIY